jgi:hopanoid biosynthesis associated radical SAM protein HpnH
MGIPIKQAVEIGSYLVKQRLMGRKHFPLVLMLEPLFRCNLACTGCGKIQHPSEVLRQNLTPEECFAAAEECGAPVVSIPGGEPLLHPQIDEIVSGLIARRKFVIMCTNAILLEKNLHKFKPSPYFTIMVHLDGPREIHDKSVDRDGVFDVAVKAIKAAKEKGFRVSTNTTVFDGADPQVMQGFFDFLTELGTDGINISPGYSYEWAPDQEHFLKREETKKLFRKILTPYREGKKSWAFYHNPLYLDFLVGEKDYECTPWGSPCYSVLGWQKPCYLLNEGYYKTFKELVTQTNWAEYGHTSGNPSCQDCMMHCGYEPTAAMDAMQPANMGRAMAGLFS